ncbi:acyltransferase family protein [Prochlorococcus marinus]|uniref:Putative membrane associated acyltransferase n=1 Tax=Prochlorococcus marinus str. GP2 TaxID=59925 RepID=A0A0A1ZJ64_PROMR|nr:acyltransferase family protein [Prochlorococcus marinus]KGF88268.1 putative membrane associated acyltransferase [Prochlorococcus marinus str. GP2]
MINIENKKLSQSKYRPEIDGLRAFAVIAVIINHFNKDLLPSGYLGVDIFFVISGFVITSAAEKESKNLFDFLSGFYERRIRRLIPGLIFFVLVSSIVICFFNFNSGVSLQTGIASLLGLSNIFLYSKSLDYFGLSADLNMFTHTWSLGVEEQFYFLFPFLIWFSGFAKQTKHGVRNLFLVMVILSVPSLIGFLYLYQNNQPAAYFLMPLRFWEIGAGCLSFLFYKNQNKKGENSSNFLTIILFLLIIFIFISPNEIARLNTLTTICITSLFLLKIRTKHFLYKILTIDKIRYIGLISYSLYLWHWSILVTSRWTIGITKYSILIQIIIMFLMAILSYEFIEKPFRTNIFNFSRFQTFALGIIISLISIFSLLILGKPLKGKLYLGNYKYINLITRSRNNSNKNIVSEYGDYSGNFCHINKGNSSINNFNFERCSIKNNNNKTFYFLGNSHSDHYRETHYLLAKKNKVSIEGISVSECLFPSAEFKRKKCQSQFVILERVKSLIKKDDVIVISNDGIGDNILELNVFIEFVLSKGAKVILFSISPNFEYPVQNCYENWFSKQNKKNCMIPKSQILKRRAQEIKIINNLKKDVFIYDPLNVLCKNNNCSVTDTSGKPLYIDQNHITDYANKNYIYPDFINFLQRNNFL